MFFAHSENENGKRHQLSVHLLNTAKIMESFTNDDEEKEIFRIIGLLHDFGKYQKAFQTYLLEGGRRGSVPHASWGAGFARILGMTDLSVAIDGHHKGLPDLGDWKADTAEYKNGEVSELEQVKQIYLNDLELTEKNLNKERKSFPDRFQKELYIRYLFSCLTDADWLDTESHFDKKKRDTRIEKTLDTESMIRCIEKHYSGLSKKGEINRLRNETRERVIEKANLPRGFYTLNLPTGMGKTLTSISWALHHVKIHGLKRIIIVLPFINIIDQTAQILKDIFGDDAVLEHHSGIQEESLKEDEYRYNPKKLACENWDYPVIITTTVQFFESLFSNKPSRCRKIHNIADAVVIFDEVQSLPKELVLPTLNMLQNIQIVMETSFLFCTATLPAFEKRESFNGLDNMVPLVDHPAILFEKTKRVNFSIVEFFNPIAIKRLYLNVQSHGLSCLVIFNTKKSALDFFKQSLPYSDIWDEHYHLSTSMCPAHRKKVINSIREDLKEDKYILVASTQLIEAGVDFDFPVVYRAIAPLESIIQSAGRCNREGKMENKGEVFLFNPEDTGMPDPTYKACAEHVQMILADSKERLNDYSFFSEYYRQIISLFVNPDKNNINPARERFLFKTVSNAYHLIDKPTETIFIWDYNEDSRILYNSIQYKEFLSRDDYRKMQPFCVQVYPAFLKNFIGYYERKEQGYLIWNNQYDEETGISTDMNTIV